MRRTVLLLLVLPAFAHEFWIAPSAFRPSPGAEVTVRLFIGDGMPGEAYARNPERISAFFVDDGSSRKDIEGAPGADPAGSFRAPKGPFVIGYRSHLSRVELTAPQFEAYLAEEGLEEIARLRAERGETGKPGREAYSRCAKALVGGRDHAVGFPLELIAEGDPSDLTPGATVIVRLLSDGKPLKGALVRAFHAKEKPVSVRTDAEGRARFVATRPGLWLFNSVRMSPAEGRKDADWESLWASLTVEIPHP
jgi:hypothetical protein